MQEDPFFVSDGPNDGYTGMSPCPGATTREDTGASGPYPTQAGSNPGFPAAGPMLAKGGPLSIRIRNGRPRSRNSCSQAGRTPASVGATMRQAST